MYEKIKDFQLTILAIVIGLSVIISACVVTKNISKDGISVTGTAYEVVKSDSASWKIEVSTQGKTNAQAYNTHAKQIPLVKEFLLSNGITPEQIDLQTVNSYPTYKVDMKTGYATNQIDFYNYTQVIKVNSDNVDKIKELSNQVQSLANKGITVTSYAPEYEYSKLAELKVKLLEAATKDSKERAKAMLKANNNHIGKILSVRMGVFQITPPDSTSVSDMGINDSSTIEKKVTAVANVFFQIK